MATTAISGPPEQGQLVNVRQRQWVVSEVVKSALSEGPLRASGESPQHLVSLSSVEDDGLGEELNVIWELEPGARVVDKVALPDPTGFDAPAQLDAFLDAVRWGASSSADVKNIQAPFRGGIDIEDCQLDPVVRAIQSAAPEITTGAEVGRLATLSSAGAGPHRGAVHGRRTDDSRCAPAVR